VYGFPQPFVLSRGEAEVEPKSKYPKAKKSPQCGLFFRYALP
jgi:hypothetical protein